MTHCTREEHPSLTTEQTRLHTVKKLHTMSATFMYATYNSMLSLSWIDLHTYIGVCKHIHDTYVCMYKHVYAGHMSVHPYIRTCIQLFHGF